MHVPDQPTSFEGSIRGDRSRARAYAVFLAAVLLVGAGLVSSLGGAGQDRGSPVPSGSGQAAVVTSSPTLRPTPAPTPRPTPVPTFAPAAAPKTAAELARTGVLVADTGDPSIGSLVADVNGTVWATRAGALLNVDPATRQVREWTLADDPVFATAALSPSRQGGVWLVGADAIRLFDGVRFRVVIPTPIPVWSVAEGADGSLWAITDPSRLIRWTDGRWIAAPGRPASVASVVVDGAGRVWTVDVDVSPSSWDFRSISAWDGSSWATYGPATLGLPTDQPASSLPSLAVAADGSLWAYVAGRLAWWSGGWTSVEVPSVGREAALAAVDEGGRAWLVEPGCEACAVHIDAWDGSAVTTYDEASGLPSAAASSWSDAYLAAGRGFVLASTGAGWYLLTEGAWRRLDLPAPRQPDAPLRRPGDRILSLVATSRSEAWMSVQSWAGATAPPTGSLFRFRDGGWHAEPLPVRSLVGNTAVAPDGSLWLATAAGPLVRRGDRWIDLGKAVASIAPPEPSRGDAGCAGAIMVDDKGTASYLGPGSGNRLVTLRLVGGAWKASVAAPAPDARWCPATLAGSADGATWLLQRGWGNILLRFAGGTWENVSLASLAEPDGQADPAAIVVDRDGTLWAVVNRFAETSSQAIVARFVDGRWVPRSGVANMDYARALSLLPDGALVVAGDGIAKFDGQQWRRLWPGLWLDALSVAPDGSVWAVGQNVYRLPGWLP